MFGKLTKLEKLDLRQGVDKKWDKYSVEELYWLQRMMKDISVRPLTRPEISLTQYYLDLPLVEIS